MPSSSDMDGSVQKARNRSMYCFVAVSAVKYTSGRGGASRSRPYFWAVDVKKSSSWWMFCSAEERMFVIRQRRLEDLSEMWTYGRSTREIRLPMKPM